MADFELFQSFGIDNGELDGLSPQECFVLGYELADIDALIRRGKSFAKPVHAKNEERIRGLCEKSGNPYSLTWMKDDESESWMWLSMETNMRIYGQSYGDE